MADFDLGNGQTWHAENLQIVFSNQIFVSHVKILHIDGLTRIRLPDNDGNLAVAVTLAGNHFHLKTALWHLDGDDVMAARCKFDRIDRDWWKGMYRDFVFRHRVDEERVGNATCVHRMNQVVTDFVAITVLKSHVHIGLRRVAGLVQQAHLTGGRMENLINYDM